MKIAIASDIHLEFGALTIKNPGDVDVLILSGDIIVENDLGELDSHHSSQRSAMFHTFFQECATEFAHVVYVAGNHEHYNGDFAHTISRLKHKLSYLPNIHILDKECVKLNNVTFVGGTLWTDMNNEDPLTMYHIKKHMNDFRVIRNSDRGSCDDNDVNHHTASTAKFQPKDAVRENKACFAYIQQVVSDNANGTVVVVGHHTPSKQSCHPCYQNDTIMNGGYHNNYDEYIIAHPQIKLWTHGHTHNEYDYMLGATRVVCNPRGYLGYEPIAQKFELVVVEL